jgi:membrane protein
VRKMRPLDLDIRSWWGALRRMVHEFRDDGLTDWAAILTYYSVLSIFPGLIALVGILGLFGGEGTINTLLDIVGRIGPDSAQDTFRSPIEAVIRDNGGAGIALLIGMVVALWTASGYVGAFIRASNVIYEVDEGRPFWKLRPLQIAITLGMILLLALLLFAVVLTGPLAQAVADPIGIGNTAVMIWSIAKWPFLLVMAMAILAVLYYASPNAHPTGFRWVTPGSVVAVLIWVFASAGFALYVANFGSYAKVYGTLAGVIVFLIWLWISNVAVLLGAELNAELERSRQLATGEHRARDRIQLEPRDEPA